MEPVTPSTRLTLESVLKSSNKQASYTDDDDDSDDQTDTKSFDLQNDDLFLQFSSRSHDMADYLQKAVNDPSASLKKLRKSLAKIDRHIRNEVVNQHDSLLSQSDDVVKLESDLSLIRDRVHMTENHINRIKNGVINPFNKFKTKAKQSRNLQIGESLLRSILRIRKLLSQLNDYFHKNKDMVKSALCISEIMLQINKPEMMLNGINIIDNKRDYILSVHQQISDLGKQKLSSGLRSLNQPNIAIGLQVFYNLGQDKLNNIIKVILSTSSDQCRESLRKALNVSTDTGTKIQTTEADDAQADSKKAEQAENNYFNVDGEDAASLSVKSSLLIRLDKCVNHGLFGNLLQIWNLEKVLRKKNDSLSRPYIELVVDEFRNTLSFWAKLIGIIKEELEQAADASSFINNVLMNEYPRLFQMLTDFYHKVESTTSHYDQTLPINQQQKLTKITGKTHRTNLIASIHHFEALFLSKCIDRIKQPLNILFGNKETRRIPTIADMRTLWTTFYNELKVTEECPDLQRDIANTIYLDGIKQMVSHLKKKIVSVSYDGGDKDENKAKLTDFRHNMDIFNCIQALYIHIYSLQEKNFNAHGSGGTSLEIKGAIKLRQECNLYLTKCCNLLYNFNCYLLYYCLRVLWYTVIGCLTSPKALSIHIQFVSTSILPLIHNGVAMDYVLKQWALCLTMLFLQCLTLNEDICNVDNIPNIAGNIAQFIKFLRIFDDDYNVDVVPSILMLQQYKRMLIEVNDYKKRQDEDRKSSAEFKSIEQLKKEHPNLSTYMICQFMLSWVYRLEHRKSINVLIGMSVDEFITTAFIKKNFFSLFAFNMNNNSRIASQRVSVDIMTMTNEQCGLLQIVASKMKDTEHPYFAEVQKIISRT